MRKKKKIGRKKKKKEKHEGEREEKKHQRNERKGQYKKTQMLSNLVTHKINNKPCNMFKKIMQNEELKGHSFLFTRSRQGLRFREKKGAIRK